MCVTGAPSHRGTGSAAADGIAVPLLTGTLALQVSAGLDHSCAVLDNGQAQCWGNGTNGRMGYDQTEVSFGASVAANLGGAVGTLGGASVLAVSCGTQVTCLLLQGGTIQCFGFGGDGRTGHGNTVDTGVSPATPSTQHGAVGSVGGEAAIHLATGSAHACIVLVSGGVQCLGNGADGRLGYGNTDSIGNDGAASAGGLVPRFGGLPAVSGLVSCWGTGLNGRLGLDSTASVGAAGGPSDHFVRLPVQAAIQAGTATAGEQITCACSCLTAVGSALEQEIKGDLGRLEHRIGDGTTATTRHLGAPCPWWPRPWGSD